MHFAGLPVLPAAQPEPLGLADPGGTLDELMAVPVVADRDVAAARRSRDTLDATRPPPSPGRSYVLVLLALTVLGLLSRVYTTNSLAGEPTPDEYLYARARARPGARLDLG